GDGFAYLILNGVIDEGDGKRVAKFLDQQADNGTAVAILMTSQGGGLEETPKISAAIIAASDQLYKKNKKRHNIFAVNEECSSACTVLTAQLTSKRNANSLEILATNSSKWGFHSPVNFRNKKITPITDHKLREGLIAKELSYYTKAGISAKWLNKNAEIFKSPAMTDFTAKQLCDEASLVIPPNACVPDQDITLLITTKLGKDAPL
ncbi:MAG: hypothetical protein ACXVA9_10490, partial [Bdellovibrionales bacterium]